MEPPGAAIVIFLGRDRTSTYGAVQEVRSLDMKRQVHGMVFALCEVSSDCFRVPEIAPQPNYVGG
jgi:hypothetical protein